MRCHRAGVALFRPGLNAARFPHSARRLSLPELPPEAFLEAVRGVVRADTAWVPDAPASLYLRPFTVATEAFLGVAGPPTASCSPRRWARSSTASRGAASSSSPPVTGCARSSGPCPWRS